MTDGESFINVRDHGNTIDEKKVRVQCNYCGKVMSGFSRLKHHLGGIRKEVVPCEKVPQSVKESFRNLLLNVKRDNLGEVVVKLSHPDLPWKRNCSPNSHDAKHIRIEGSRNAGYGSAKHEDMASVAEDVTTEHIYKTRMGSNLSSKAQKLIGRFFYEAGIDFHVANSSSFQRMITGLLGNGLVDYKLPTSQELKGWILQGEVKEMQEYVKGVKRSWPSTGCSVLLDEWVDEKGRNLVSFIVECPKGPIYIRSTDISAILGDVDALQSLLDGVIEEVGVENVVQVVACSAAGWLGAVGKQFMDRRRTVFWSVSASHCIQLMLGKIGTMVSIKATLEKAKIITKFIYGHGEILKLMRSYTESYDLIKTSRQKPAVPFLNLEVMVSEKKHLTDMFASSQWKNSVWASSVEGKRVARLIEDFSFWTGAGIALKGTIPLLRVLCLINEADEPQVGYIYETMDQAKEAIEEEFNKKKSQYTPFWAAIDEIWNTHLHSPLHAAGYYLNPSLFYSTNFCMDAEVTSGLLRCSARMVQDQRTQDIVSSQLDEYTHARGAFKEGSLVCKRTNVHPAQWWRTYGEQCPELQSFAIRILSQTCDGGERYGLKRDLAEKLLTRGRNRVEQRRLSDLAFVHYNLQLQNKELGAEGEVDPMDEWVVDEAQEEIAIPNGGSEWMYSDCTEASISVEGPPPGFQAKYGFQVKEEPL